MRCWLLIGCRCRCRCRWLVVVMMVMLQLFRLLAAAPASECRRVPFLPLCSFVALNPQLAPFFASRASDRRAEAANIEDTPSTSTLAHSHSHPSVHTEDPDGIRGRRGRGQSGRGEGTYTRIRTLTHTSDVGLTTAGEQRQGFAEGRGGAARRGSEEARLGLFWSKKKKKKKTTATTATMSTVDSKARRS